MSNYRKALVALAGFLGVLSTVLADGAVNTEEAIALVSAALAAFGVYRVPNIPGRS